MDNGTSAPPGNDPVAGLIGRLDGPLAPPAAFADGLRGRLLAEIGAARVQTGEAETMDGGTTMLGPNGTATGTVERRVVTTRHGWARLGSAVNAVAAAVLALTLLGSAVAAWWLLPEPDGPMAGRGGAVSTPGLGSPTRPQDGGPLAAPKERWNARIDGASGRYELTPVVADGIAFATGHTTDKEDVVDETYLLAHDLATGQERWRIAASALGGEQFGPVAAAAGTLYVELTGIPVRHREAWTDALVALDARDGTERWRVEVGDGGTHAPPALSDGLVLVEAAWHVVIGIDAVSGIVRWRSESPEPILLPDQSLHAAPSMTVADGFVFLAQTDLLRALDARTGTEQWRFNRAGLAWGGAAAGDGSVYAFSGGGDADGSEDVLIALDAATGGERWTREVEDPAFAPIVGDGLLFYLVGTSGDPSLVAVDAASGRDRWVFNPDGYIPVLPVLANGVLYVTNEVRGLFGTDFSLLGAANRLYAVEGNSGDERWQIEPPVGSISQLAIGEGMVLFSDYESRNGALYAYGDR